MGHKPDVSAFTAFGLISQVGLTVALPLVAGTMVGAYLDRRLDTGGLLVVAGVLLGLLSGGYAAWRLLAKELE